MTIAFVAEQSIAQPPDRVWKALTDWDEAHRWMNGIDRMSADGPNARGTKVTFHTRGKDRDAEIVAYEEGSVIALRSVQGSVTADYRYEVKPSGDGNTAVTLTADCEARGWLAILGPLIRFGIRRTDSGQLEALRDVVER